MDELLGGDLVESNALPAIALEVAGAPGTFNGACAYDDNSSRGVIFGQVFPDEIDLLRLFMSGIEIPE